MKAELTASALTKKEAMLLSDMVKEGGFDARRKRTALHRQDVRFARRRTSGLHFASQAHGSASKYLSRGEISALREDRGSTCRHRRHQASQPAEEHHLLKSIGDFPAGSEFRGLMEISV